MRGVPSCFMTDEQVGLRVHNLMWSQRITQRDLADQIGLTQTGLGKKLRGSRPWYVAELVAIAPLLGTTASDLLADLPASEWAPRGSNPQPTDYKSDSRDQLAA